MEGGIAHVELDDLLGFRAAPNKPSLVLTACIGGSLANPQVDHAHHELVVCVGEGDRARVLCENLPLLLIHFGDHGSDRMFGPSEDPARLPSGLDATVPGLEYVGDVELPSGISDSIRPGCSGPGAGEDKGKIINRVATVVDLDFRDELDEVIHVGFGGELFAEDLAQYKLATVLTPRFPPPYSRSPTMQKLVVRRRVRLHVLSVRCKVP